MSDKGALYDLTPFVRRDKVDMGRWYTLEEIYAYKGKQHGMPFWQAVSMCAYNASLFRRENVSPPGETWTWDTLLDAARRLTKPGETWGLQMPYGFEFGWLNFLRGAGADYLNKERTKTTLNTPAAIEALQWVQDLTLKHRVLAPPGDTSLGTGDLFLQGKVGINLTSVGFVGNARTAKPSFEWDFFVMPKHPRTGKRGGTVDDLPFVVTRDTKAPEAAWKLNLFVAEKFSQDLVGKLGLQMPALKASAADPQGWLAPPPATMRVSLDQVKFAGTLSYHKNWMQWYGELTTQLLPAFKGEKSVKDACDQASQVGDTLLRGV
jgi:multiple sugar transport system substrate-binding protein